MLQVHHKIVDEVRGPDHAMPEAVRGGGELHRHERPPAPVEELEVGGYPCCLPSADRKGLAAQDVVDHAPVAPRAAVARVAIDNPPKEIVDHHPLVVPADQPLSFFEQIRAREAGLVEDAPDHPVVELEEQDMQLGNDQVLIVSRVTDQSTALDISRQIGTTECGGLT